MKPLTLPEAAQFLRMSRSSLYQRKDIPRYRLPDSRIWLYDQDELEALLKHGLAGGHGQPVTERLETAVQRDTETTVGVVDISTQRVYHRNPRYR